VFLKLQEEMGELAQAINIPEKCSEDFRGETADVILVLLDLYLMLCSSKGMTHSQAYAELEVFMSTKAVKWEDYVVMCEKALEDE
jgi:NTP pyrophosphatase (non-canonical NTP hydrolase)